MPAWSAAAPPAGIESDQNVMLCGPPETFVKRTVVPGAIVRVFGSNAARVLPFPVIFTSTTGPAGAAGAAAAPAGGAAGGGGCCGWAGFFPQASGPTATTGVSRAERIARFLRGLGERGCLGTDSQR